MVERKRLLLGILIFWATLWVSCVQAIEVSALKSVDVLDKSQTEFWMAFHFKCQNGEKIQAGKETAPQITLSDGENIQTIQVTWPPLEDYESEGVHSHIFADPVVIPVLVHIDKPGHPVRVKGHISYISCGKICEPGESSFDIHIPIGAPKASPDALLIDQALQARPAFENTDILKILIFAILGGVILNFMPCVLPVLGLKFMGIMSSTSSAAPKLGYIMTILGIFFSFWAFAFITSILKILGTQVGWGMHFQQPIFLIFMICLMVFFSLNLFGAFEILLPQFMRRWMDNFSDNTKLSSSFVSGVFATLLATPCTAPFLGISVGYALTRDTGDIFMILSAIALGFSLPYWLLLILPPQFIPHPKPGKWMVWIKWTLGVFLMATGVWLSVVLYTNITLSDTVDQPTHLSLDWKPFEPEKIPSLLKSGKSVVVNITASWCLTCHINGTYMSTNKAIVSKLGDPNIYLMKGDWTKKDNQISKFLKQYDRSGIPFTIIFTPSQTKGIILPEIVREKNLLEALSHSA
jgi:suppressor for copper-sensitivity B